jgi:hypothetical protein
MAVLIEIADEPVDVVGDLSFQRGRDHPPSALASSSDASTAEGGVAAVC